MNVEEVVVGPFHSSTAPLQVALLVLQQLKGRCTHINTQFHKGSRTSSLFFCISGQGRSRYSYSLIHMLNNCSNVRNLRAPTTTQYCYCRSQSTNGRRGQKLHNKILSGYFMNAEPFFSGFWIDTNIYSPRALIS